MNSKNRLIGITLVTMTVISLGFAFDGTAEAKVLERFDQGQHPELVAGKFKKFKKVKRVKKFKKFKGVKKVKQFKKPGKLHHRHHHD